MKLTPPQLLLTTLLTTLTLLALLTLYTERRRRRLDPNPNPDNIFRCKNCHYVYTDDPNVERARCPHCSAMNTKYTY